MLGSDPLAALLGAGTDPRCSQTVWKTYLRRLVEAGAAITMLGPDVVFPPDASDDVKRALNALVVAHPPGVQMPAETSGVLAGKGVVDSDPERVNNRVAAYYRHITKTLGKDLAPELLASGAVTPGVGLHVSSSEMVAVVVPDGEALRQWRLWSAEISGDLREQHSAPTVTLPNTPGGGVYLFRTTESTAVPATLRIDREFTVHTGDFIVPIPPTRVAGRPAMRLGPARILPDWLRSVLLHSERATPRRAEALQPL